MFFGKKAFGKEGRGKISPVYCTICKREAGFVGYTPKKEWNVTGKLCSKCYARLLGERKDIPQEPKLENADKITADVKQTAPQNVKTNQDHQEIGEIKPTTDYDPLHFLKLRLAKGEITKEEFEELRKMIQS